MRENFEDFSAPDPVQGGEGDSANQVSKEDEAVLWRIAAQVLRWVAGAR